MLWNVYKWPPYWSFLYAAAKLWQIAKMHYKKLRIDIWLKSHLQQGDLHGLEWLNKTDQELIKISWNHKSGHNWGSTVAGRKDNIFLAYHQARSVSDSPKQSKKLDYRRLKQNFRCALRGSKHIRFEQQLSQTRGSSAYRVYRFLYSAETAAFPDDEDYDVNQGLDTVAQSSDCLVELPCLDGDNDLDAILNQPADDDQQNYQLPDLQHELEVLLADDCETPAASLSPVSIYDPSLLPVEPLIFDDAMEQPSGAINDDICSPSADLADMLNEDLLLQMFN